MEIRFVPGAGYDSNTYLFSGSHPAIVDTGTGAASAERILSATEKIAGCRDVEAILLTHEHLDHAGGAPALREKTGAKIACSKKCAQILKEGSDASARLFGIEPPRFETDRALCEGDTIRLGDDVFLVLETPGHSQGSICLYCDESGTLISGDTVFAGGGVGRWDLPGGDYETLVESIKLLATLDVETLLPGHGPTVERGAKRQVDASLRNLAGWRGREIG
ncbi:MAG: hypothetical protein CVT48_00225 [Thermoplasmata archaeon HGW-Thermoplasmata-1]|nr:MAG: hypothetical protein CVT48_00225 [Thermoplasmata archaeon HGW-Thermoplasmata-1]